jgi:DNA-binding transcriptional MerR regulator
MIFNGKNLLTHEELKDFLGISYSTIWKWEKNKILHPSKVPGSNLKFYDKEEIENYILKTCKKKERELMTLDQLEDYCNVNRNTIYQWETKGFIDVHHVPGSNQKYYDKEQIDQVTVVGRTGRRRINAETKFLKS